MLKPKEIFIFDWLDMPHYIAKAQINWINNELATVDYYAISPMSQKLIKRGSLTIKANQSHKEARDELTKILKILKSD